MWTWRFWREALERAVKAAAQALLLALSGDKVFSVLTADWQVLVGAAMGGALLSILTSLISLPVGAADSPSAIK